MSLKKSVYEEKNNETNTIYDYKLLAHWLLLSEKILRNILHKLSNHRWTLVWADSER